MRTSRVPAAVLAAAVLAGPARAAEPVVVELPEQATVRTSLVTVGDVARVSGGDAAARGRVAGLDLAEFRPHESSLGVSRRAVEYRLRLAGIGDGVRVGGADRAAVNLSRRAVTADEVVSAARAELMRRLPSPAGIVELAAPVAVKLPEVAADDPVTIKARPHAPAIRTGRTQVDVVISAGGEELLALAVHFEVRPVAKAEPAAAPVVPAAGTAVPATPVAAGPGEVLVKPRQRVALRVQTGGLTITAVGEAQQEGRLGQTILVQNVDSKKSISARVTGPGAVDVELGGAP